MAVFFKLGGYFDSEYQLLRKMANQRSTDAIYFRRSFLLTTQEWQFSLNWVAILILNNFMIL